MTKRRSKEEVAKDKQDKLIRKNQRQIEKEKKQIEKSEKLRLKQIEFDKKLKEKSEKNQIQKEWVDLYEYVKKEILEYSDDMKLPDYMLLRLRGLAKGQFLANKKIIPMANYDYKTILYTFKLCKQSILIGFRSNNTKFKDEKHKFNYAMVIIENNINDIVIRLKNAEVAKEKAENVEMENIYHEGAEYQTKTKEENNTLKDLW